MTTSGTTTFNVSAQDLIDLALTDIGANGPAYADPTLRPHALKALNLVVKSLDTKGEFTWRTPRRVVTLVAGQASYVLASDAYDIDQPARYLPSGSTTGSQVTAMVRDEYMSLPDRTLTGIPYRFYVDKALDVNGLVVATMYLYPTPANSGDTIEVAEQVRAQDVTSISQTIDVNQKWLDAIRWSLASGLAPAYGLPIDRMEYFKTLADEKVSQALGDDGERADVQLVPFGGSYSYTYRGGGY